MTAIHRKLHPKLRASLPLLCALAPALADYLFFGHPLGCNAAIFMAALLAMIAVRVPRLFASVPSAILFALAAGLAAALAIEPGALPLGMSVFASGLLAMTAQSGWTFDLAAWLARWKSFVSLHWPRMRLWERWARRARPASLAGATLHRAAGSARLWALPLAMGALFVALFASANPVIDRWLDFAGQRLLRLADFIPDLPTPARVALWLAAAWFAWIHLRRLPSSPRSQAPLGPEAPIQWEGLVSAPVLMRCLGLFNAIFLAQTSLDLYYLWGGAQLPHGMTLAEYAHRGAYPLVATALIAAAFVLLTFRPGGREEGLRAARLLVYLWLAQNALLTLSAVWRLRLYVDAYTLTRWRVAAGLWMALVGSGLGWIAWRIAAGRSNAWLVRANLATALALLYGCCFVDFDGWIANHNVRHCAEMKGEGPRLDLNYLEDLGAEAIPALRWYAAQPGLPAERSFKARAAADRLRFALREQMSDWRGWTGRRSQIAAADGV